MSNPIPSALALTAINDCALITASPHRNNYAAIQALANALVGQFGAAGGGGGGGYARKMLRTNIGTHTVAVGGAGGGGSPGAGGTGGNTAFNDSLGANVLLANGGAGGASGGIGAIWALGGTGGAPGTGDVSGGGISGDAGFQFNAAGSFLTGRGGSPCAFGGTGGTPVLSAASNGNGAPNFGSGGGGAGQLASLGAKTGGPGAPGVMPEFKLTWAGRRIRHGAVRGRCPRLPRDRGVT
jgi:hypothetical protein